MIVYFSELLKNDSRSKSIYPVLLGILERHGIEYNHIVGTKDIWCRDYMPIHVRKNELIQFRYEPSYLNHFPNLRSVPKIVNQLNNLSPTYSNINLDGGNVVKNKDHAIISDRIFSENPEYRSKSKLISDIENLLQVEVIIIPCIKYDMTGHSDGYVRFVDPNTLIGTDRSFEYRSWANNINSVLNDHKLDYIDLPTFEYRKIKYPHNAIGCYTNYLEIEDLIVVPVFEVSGNRDEDVVSIMNDVFPNRTIETININSIGLDGGLLNCISWVKVIE
jgi:agmatine deiminase